MVSPDIPALSLAITVALGMVVWGTVLQASQETSRETDQQRTGPRDRSIMLALVSFCLAVGIVLISGRARVTYDDGFYYFKIAQNVAHGKGSTFDGIHPTNGYHPLWMLLLVLINWCSSSSEKVLVIGNVVQAVLWSVCVIPLYLTARLSSGRPASSLAVMLWIAFTYPIALGGMEFSLEAVCLLSTAYLYSRWLAHRQVRGHGIYLGLGLFLSLTLLARTDTILLAAVLGIFLVCRELQAGLSREGFSRLLAFGLPVTITCLAYAGSNLLLFGHALQVSSVVKRAWSQYLLTNDPVYQSGGWLAAKAHHLFPLLEIRKTHPLVVGIACMVGLWIAGLFNWGNARRLAWLKYARLALSPFAIFALLQLLSCVLIYHGGLSFEPWYFVIEPWLTALLGAMLFERLLLRLLPLPFHASLMRARWLFPLIMVIISCGVAFRILRAVKLRIDRERPGVSLDPLEEAAMWAKANLPDDAVIGSWNAGAIGYVSDRRVVNLDGLVNSWQYYLKDRYNLCSYWQETGITYLVDVFRDGHAMSVVPTESYYRACTQRLRLVWSDARYGQPWRVEVYRIEWNQD